MIVGSLVFSLICYAVPLALPLIIGIIILTRFEKENLIRLVASFTLKPVVAYPFWILIRFGISPLRIGLMPAPLDLLGDLLLDLRASLLAAIPAIALTLAIVYVFRQVFKARSAQLFLIGDVVRWFYTFVVSVTVFNYSGSPPYLGMLLIFIGFLLPSVYAIAALIFVTSVNNFQTR
ncbi:MAG: hypothetical protein AUJ21_03365 [Anaerolineae bacterium CG1_02_58_13]|nr:MAG: hypothetical protein AUJ21_03365 [Anaerolineae bacterium CG1_02_58_13]